MAKLVESYIKSVSEEALDSALMKLNLHSEEFYEQLVALLSYTVDTQCGRKEFEPDNIYYKIYSIIEVITVYERR